MTHKEINFNWLWMMSSFHFNFGAPQIKEVVAMDMVSRQDKTFLFSSPVMVIFLKGTISVSKRGIDSMKILSDLRERNSPQNILVTIKSQSETGMESIGTVMDLNTLAILPQRIQQ